MADEHRKPLRAVAATLALRALIGAAALTPAQAQSEARVIEGEWQDATRQRSVPWRAYLPPGGAQIPVVVYSHGLGGSRLAGEHWGRHWAANGIASVHVQHAGSDSALLARGEGDPMARLRGGMNSDNLALRVGDVRFAIGEVERLAASGSEPWKNVDPARLGVAGHSFGAVTTQALAGQRYPPDYAPSPWTDARVKAALAFSPSIRQAEPARAFGHLSVPFFSVTGSKDAVPGVRDVDADNRVLPFQGMPAGNKYLLVFDGAEHSAFSGARAGELRLSSTAQRVRPAIQHASTLFWRAHLLGDRAAADALAALPNATVLGPTDRFERK
ncbi:MAG: hypothetical protein WAO95_05545 [Burkholderiales bacterium]